MTRIKTSVQPAIKRIKNFQEISLGFSKKSMIDEAIRYIDCLDSACNHGCPLGVDIPAFIRMVREGDSAGALAKIREKNDLPSICGRVCNAPCERACGLAVDKTAINIRALERYASDHGRPRFAFKKKVMPTGKKVAIIGSGPAGLTAAVQLAKAGLKVLVYEMMPLCGGMLRYGIPEFRLPKNVLDAEIEEIRSLGVEFKTNFVVGQGMRFEQFMGEGYAAVLLTVGRNTVGIFDLPGADLGGVHYAKELLLNVNSRFEDQIRKTSTIVLGPQVVVCGVGQSALDCARVCLRLGREVTMIFPKTIEDLRLYPEDFEYAKEEGLKFEALTKPLAILADSPSGNYAVGVQCVRMDFADVDGSGKWELKPAPASEFVVPAQTVIWAGGYKTNCAPLALGSNLKTLENGSIIVDEQTSLTSVPHLYAAGDAVAGVSTVVNAMASGKKAAAAIISSLKYEK